MLRTLALAALASALAGCSPSIWEREFVSSGASALPLAPGATVERREIAWERVDRAVAEQEALAVESDVHPSEWSIQRRAEADAGLLRWLQVSEDPARVTILGRSGFRTTAELRATDPELESFAREIGADRVAWSRQYLGKAETIRREPVTEWRSGTWWGWDRHGRDYRPRSYDESATTWVPVRVEADEWAWMVFFLRLEPEPGRAADESRPPEAESKAGAR